MILLRTCLAIVLGVVIGSAVNMGLINAGPMVIPPPVGVDMSSIESMEASIHLLQWQHYIFPFLAHALGTFSGCLVGFLIAAQHREIMVWIIGTIFLAGGITASFMIPAPAGFILLDLAIAYLPMAWLGIRVGRSLS